MLNCWGVFRSSYLSLSLGVDNFPFLVCGLSLGRIRISFMHYYAGRSGRVQYCAVPHIESFMFSLFFSSFPYPTHSSKCELYFGRCLVQKWRGAAQPSLNNKRTTISRYHSFACRDSSDSCAGLYVVFVYSGKHPDEWDTASPSE